MFFVFVGYVSIIWIKYGVQKSISQSYYCLPEKWNFLFTLFCWGFAIPATILGVEVTGLMFFAGAGIAFVGAAAAIANPFTYKVHMTAAISGIIFSQLAIYFGYHMPLVNLISVGLCAIFPFITKKYFWWMELVTFFAIVCVMFINL